MAIAAATLTSFTGGIFSAMANPTTMNTLITSNRPRALLARVPLLLTSKVGIRSSSKRTPVCFSVGLSDPHRHRARYSHSHSHHRRIYHRSSFLMMQSISLSSLWDSTIQDRTLSTSQNPRLLFHPNYDSILRTRPNFERLQQQRLRSTIYDGDNDDVSDTDGMYSSPKDDSVVLNDDDFYEDDFYEGDIDIDIDDNTNIESNPTTSTSTSTNEVQLLYQTIRTSVENTHKNLTKKKNSLEKEIEKAKSLEQTLKRANLIVSNLYRIKPGTERITVEDWDLDGQEVELVLNYDEYGTAQEEADVLFATARKMKRGSRIVEEMLVGVHQGLELLTDALMDLDAAVMEGEQDSGIDQGRLLLLQDRLERTASKTGFKLISPIEDTTSNAQTKGGQQLQPRKQEQKRRQSTRYEPTFRTFTSPAGCKILVGRNRRENESLCFQTSRPEDLWLHSRGCPGAHVLIQIRRGSPTPTDACRQMAADLAAFYSDARSERKAPITMAYAKHIQKPRGAPLGAVKVRREEGSLLGRPDAVAEELKVKREESGVGVGWEEGSKGDKAKNRKWTKEVAKSAVDKKRAEKRAKKKRGRNADDNL